MVKEKTIFANGFTLKFINKSMEKKYVQDRLEVFRLKCLIYSGVILAFQIFSVISNYQFIKFLEEMKDQEEPGVGGDKESIPGRIKNLEKLLPVTFVVLGITLINGGFSLVTYFKKTLLNWSDFFSFFSVGLVAINVREIFMFFFTNTYGAAVTIEIFLKVVYISLIMQSHILVIINTIISTAIRWITAMFISKVALPELGLNTVVLAGVALLSYVMEKSNRNLWYYKNKVTRKNEWLKSTLDNIQNGLIVLDKSRLHYFNEYVFKHLHFLLEKNNPNEINNKTSPGLFVRSRDRGQSVKTVLSKGEFKNALTLGRSTISDKKTIEMRSVFNELIEAKNGEVINPSSPNRNIQLNVENDKQFSPHLKKEYCNFYLIKSLFKNLENINSQLSSELIEAINNPELNLQDVLLIIESDNNSKNLFQDFIFIGNKKFEVEACESGFQQCTYLEIFLRIVEKEDSKIAFEFIFNDVTRMKVTEEAKAQIKYKSLFLAKVAHEFKNPLIIIKELVDQIIEELPSIYNNNDIFNSHTMIDNLLLSKNLSSYLLILVKDFEVISKKENSSKIELIKSKFDLREEMSYLEQIVQTLISKKYGGTDCSPVRFFTRIKDDVPEEVITDKTRLSQILINLVSNSIKFTHNGNIDLLIEFNSANNKIRFTVKDEGNGINENEMKNLFKYFYKSNDINNIYGSGLGLSIVKELVSLLGGEIEFSHNQPTGSIFSFEIDYWDGDNPIEDTNVIFPNAEATSRNERKSKFTVMESPIIKIRKLKNRGSKYFTHKFTLTNNKVLVKKKMDFNINKSEENDHSFDLLNKKRSLQIFKEIFRQSSLRSRVLKSLASNSQINTEMEEMNNEDSQLTNLIFNNLDEVSVSGKVNGPMIDFKLIKLDCNHTDSMFTQNDDSPVEVMQKQNTKTIAIDNNGGCINFGSSQISNVTIVQSPTIRKSNFYPGQTLKTSSFKLEFNSSEENFISTNLKIKKTVKTYKKQEEIEKFNSNPNGLGLTMSTELNKRSSSSKLVPYSKTGGKLVSGGKINILIADDETFIRKSIIRQIDKYISSLNIDFEIVIIESNDGIESLYSVYSSLIQNFTIDLIISDETMKYISGSFFSEIMNKLSIKIPIAIVTAYEDAQSNTKYAFPSICGVFSKPVNFDILQNIFCSAKVLF